MSGSSTDVQPAVTEKDEHRKYLKETREQIAAVESIVKAASQQIPLDATQEGIKAVAEARGGLNQYLRGLVATEKTLFDLLKPAEVYFLHFL